MNLIPRKDQLVNVYLDINPLTNKPFYVGIGGNVRLMQCKRNRFHRNLIETFPDKNFIRKVIYHNISIQKAWKIEKQIIKKCGRLVNNTGILTNIHDGGPLPMEDSESVHWLKGKKLKDINPFYVSPRYGKSYYEQYGVKKYDIIKKRTESRKGVIERRIQEKGRTQKEIESSLKRIERRKNKQYTEREIKSFQDQSLRQNGKSMKERLQKTNWIDPRKGKTAIEIYGENYKGPPNKGKTYKEMKGSNYIDPRAKSFTIQINNNDPIFCESEKDFCKKFNCNDILLRKFKEHGEWKITRQSNSKHIFPNNSIVKFNYIK